MTTSLPPASPETPFAAAPAGAANPALLGAFANAFTPLIAAAGDGAVPVTPDFAQLLRAEAPAPAPAPVALPGVAAGEPRSVLCRVATETAVAAVAASEATGATAPAGTPDADLPERSTLEAALALMMPLLMTPPPPAAGPEIADEAAAAEAALPQAIDAVATHAEEPQHSAELPDGETRTVRVTLSIPGRAPIEVELPLTEDPLPLAEIANALMAKSAPTATAARDGMRIGATAVPGVNAVAEPQLAAPSPTTGAEVALPHGVKLALTLPSAPPAAQSAAHASASALSLGSSLPRAALPPAGARRENSAAAAVVSTPAISAPMKSAEKNFLSTGEQPVTPGRSEAGIAVAQMPSAMSSASPASLATAPAVVPVAALVEKLPSSVAADAPAPAHATASLASRAVDTVSSIVESQIASRMQPAPSVQLRFKVGSEDLSVRVELRNGEVRTEFKTDSAELRSALSQEWRAITARPEATVRFLEPVITTSNAPGQGSSFSSHGQQSSSQQQQHAQQQFRAQAEFFGTVSRSFAAAPAGSEAAAAVTPLVLPTSQRLSAVA